MPALHFGGWYDVFRDGTLKNFRGIMECGADENTRNNQKLVMGPWYHLLWSGQTGQIDFGEEARSMVDDLQIRWFDYWLKGKLNGCPNESPVKIFVMGENAWRDEDNWPPKGTFEKNYYLHSQGRANTRDGDGRLALNTPQEEPPDIYVYDPRLPIASAGGHSCCFPGVEPMGPADQRDTELQHGVLVYTTEPLKNDLLVIGPVAVTLWAASSQLDTDFTCKLVDVYPDGLAVNLTEGILRARYRDSIETPSLLKPDEIYKLTVRLGNICNKFKAGHRIRLEVSSSNFPHWDRNTNTGNIPGIDGFSEIKVAAQTIFHDAARPSFIRLPILSA